MQKPNNYDNTPAGGNYEAPELGGHHMIIKQVNETQTKAGKPMVVILVDFAKNDKQPELFMTQFKDDIRPDRKWPRGGTIYCPTTDKDGKTSRNFKTFCTCFEKSNGTTINWVDNSAQWCGQFKNKKIGGVYGIVHSEYQGEEKVRTEFRWFVTDDKVESAQIPNEKMLSEAERARLTSKPGSDGDFVNVPDGVDDEGLPFN